MGSRMRVLYPYSDSRRIRRHLTPEHRAEWLQKRQMFVYQYLTKHMYISSKILARAYNELYPDDLVNGTAFYRLIRLAEDIGWIEMYGTSRRRLYKSLLCETEEKKEVSSDVD